MICRSGRELFLRRTIMNSPIWREPRKGSGTLTFPSKNGSGEIIFLRNLVEGAASHSYGIHVATVGRFAVGPVIERAKEILQNLESGEAEGKRADTGKRAAPTRPNLCRWRCSDPWNGN